MPEDKTPVKRPTRRAHKPAEYVIAGAWPRGVMEENVGAQVVQAIARTLADAMERRGVSLNAFAQQLGLNRQLLANLLAGETWPDVLTVATLERRLGIRLYPDHLAWPDGRDPGVGETETIRRRTGR